MRPRTSFVLFLFLLSLIGAGTIPASANVLPAGTIVHIRTTQPIFADLARRGTRISGFVDRRVAVGGRVVIPGGAAAIVEVADRSWNRDRVNLRLRSIRVGRTRYTVSTNAIRLDDSLVPGGRPLSLPPHMRLRFEVNRATRIGR